MSHVTSNTVAGITTIEFYTEAHNSLPGKELAQLAELEF